MTSRSGYFFSTIGRKQIMALAGLGLCLFVLGHVLGNFLMFVSPEAYNMYGHKLTSNPLIYAAEIGLVVFLLAHVVAALILTIRNKGAREVSYAKSGTGDKKTSLTTKTMWWQGVVVLVFIVLHLITFKYGTVYMTEINGEPVRDLFRLVVEVFQSPVYVLWYVAAVALLGFHLTHGFQSSIQTLGFNHPLHTPKVKKISLIYGLLVSLGFIAQPLYMFFIYQG
jgi:succinate dehydrogenase / fumarate reductase cytochrome b subunit